MNIIFVGLGGAVGAILRYLLSLIPLKTDFPFITLFTNLIGALVIGFVVGIAINKNINEKAVLFLKTGVCGGFTTFSTFSLEALNLFENSKPLFGTIYMIISVVLCIFGVMLGRYISTILVK